MIQGYLDAVDPAQHADVELGGEVRRVPRACLGLHLRLARLARRFDESDDPERMAALAREYLAACGLEPRGNGAELLLACAQLRRLNEWRWELPWMREPLPPRQPPAYEYPGRVWAWWVHKLASRYGWTRDEVFVLWPEEAACYMQEVFVAEFDEAEERRSLWDGSYKYDRGSKTSRFIPMRRPGWMVDRAEPRRHRIRGDMVPVGKVIKLDEILH